MLQPSVSPPKPAALLPLPPGRELSGRALRKNSGLPPPPPGSKLLTVQGTWQSDKGENSLIALKLKDHTALLGGLSVGSRDFR